MKKTAFLLLGLALPAVAQAQGGVPVVIKERVNQLVAQCVQAGGRLGDMNGQGRFVIPQDFTGDGKIDFVVSEGNVPCTGKPDLFRQNGHALVELYVGDGAGNARLAFADRLMAYRIVAGSPAKLQVARRGAGCGAGTPANAACGHELRWNANASQFVEVLTGADKGVTSPPARPVAGAAPAPAPSPSPAAASAGAAAGTAGSFPVKDGADARFKAACRKEILSAEPQATKWVDEECANRWKAVVAAGPAADALLAAIGGPRDTAGLKARMSSVRWGAAQQGSLASGRAGNMEIALSGKGQPQQASANWNATGEEIPFDIIGAFDARGITARMVSCEKMGVGEGNRSYVVTPPGGKPFGVSIDLRTAPTANAMSYYGATIDLSGKLPPAGSTRCEYF